MIGTNLAVEVSEAGGVDEEYPMGNGAREGAADVLEKESSEYDDRSSNVDRTHPITCQLFNKSGTYAHLHLGKTMHVK